MMTKSPDAAKVAGDETFSLFRFCCAALIAFASGGCSLLQPPPPPTLFQQMDTNRDGKLTRAEFDTGFANAMLTVYNLGRMEQSPGGVERRGARRTWGSSFQRLDVNHDGKLSPGRTQQRQRAQRGSRRDFDRIDKNHDGVISVEEGRPSGLDRTPQERAQGTGL